jgi:hypothetical protein
MKHFTFNKIQFTLGTSAEDNWSAIRNAPRDSFWVHMEGRPSAHVIIHLDVEPTHEELLYAASLIKNQTKSAPSTPQQYVWSPVANLRLGSKAGEVILKSKTQVKYFSY